MAGAWLQPANKGLIATSATYYHSDGFYDNRGRFRKQSAYKKHEISTYAEWGYNDLLTVGGNVFLNQAAQSGKSNYTISDTELFARTRLWHDDTRTISLQPLLKLPSFAYRGKQPQSGSETWEAELALLYGETIRLLSDKDFIDVSTALRTRSDGFSEQWRSTTRYGLNLSNEVLLLSSLYITRSFTVETPTTFREGGDYDYDLTKAELSLLYTLESGNYAQASLFKHIEGVQSGAGTGISLTFGQQF